MSFDSGWTTISVVNLTEQVTTLRGVTARIQILLSTPSQSANMGVPLSLKGWICWLHAASVLGLVEHSIVRDVRVPVGSETARFRHLVLHDQFIRPWVRHIRLVFL